MFLQALFNDSIQKNMIVNLRVNMNVKIINIFRAIISECIGHENSLPRAVSHKMTRSSSFLFYKMTRSPSFLFYLVVFIFILSCFQTGVERRECILIEALILSGGSGIPGGTILPGDISDPTRGYIESYQGICRILPKNMQDLFRGYIGSYQRIYRILPGIYIGSYQGTGSYHGRYIGS